MLTGIHLLMTYKCTLECDHCFLYSSPRVKGTMTIAQIRSVLSESQKIESIEWIYFEGGEPLLYYPTLIEGIRLARNMGYKVGIVTNSYAAVSAEDAEALFRPIAELGVSFISISDDSFHYGEEDNPAKHGLKAVEKLGIPTAAICIEEPFIDSSEDNDESEDKGKPIIGGGAKFRGRAVEKLTEGLPKRPCNEFIKCPYEDFDSPSRVHLDCYGNVQLCQGISMGNMWQEPLSEIVTQYDVNTHPICGPLNEGGPLLLAEKYKVDIEDQYIDECHLCYETRKSLIEKFPELLAPKQVYGIK